jgi:hypothetical protein
MYQDMYHCSGFQGQMVAYSVVDLDHCTIGIKEEPEFDFNGMLRVVGSLGKSNKQIFYVS